MKKQAWGWLAAAVMAAGLNASYHDGGLQWAHALAEQVGHNTSAVLALATGRADQFLVEAQILASRHGNSSCPLANAWVQSRQREGFGRIEEMWARQQVQLSRLEANRARMEARFATMRVPARFDAMVIASPHVSVCPRVRVSVPRLPVIKVPVAPVIHIENPGAGPV